MRFFCFCFFAVLIQAQVHRTQIIQTYVYEVNSKDFNQIEKEGQIFVILSSPSLIQFFKDQKNATNYTQSVRFNEGYTEFKSFDQAIFLYANAPSARLKFNLAYKIFELTKVDENTYILKHAIYPIQNLTQCRFIVQKTLTSLTNEKKDFVINLDNQYYFSKLLATHKFLQCARD